MQPQQIQLKQQGRLAFERRDYATALALFQEFLAEYPGFADVRHFAGLCLVFLGRTEEALEQLDLALATNPGYVEAHINRALVLQDLGRYEDAREAFENAGRIEQETEGRFPAAVAARLANAHMAVGDLYLEAGAFTEAVQEYQTALEMRPKYHDIRNKLATAFMGLDRMDDALTELHHVLESNPRFLAARLNLGLALYRLGRVPEAAQEWETCRVQKPEDPQVRAYVAMIDQTPQGPSVE